VRILEATDAEIARVVPAGEQPLINVGCGEDATVADTAALVRDVLGSDARIEWDAAKPDGTPRKLLDIGRITRLGWRPSIRLRDGIALAYADFLLHRERLAACSGARGIRERGSLCANISRYFARYRIAADASGNNFQGCRRAADLQREHPRL
jgi:hypothetical protein